MEEFKSIQRKLDKNNRIIQMILIMCICIALTTAYLTSKICDAENSFKAFLLLILFVSIVSYFVVNKITKGSRSATQNQ